MGRRLPGQRPGQRRAARICQRGRALTWRADLAAGQAQTECCVLTLRSARQMALLHLKPDPNAICHTRSPRRTLPFVSMLASTYLRRRTGFSNSRVLHAQGYQVVSRHYAAVQLSTALPNTPACGMHLQCWYTPVVYTI